MESNLSGMDDIAIASEDQEQRIKIITEKLKIAAPNRLLLIAQAMREGMSIKEVAEITKYDKWFLEQIKGALDVEAKVKKEGLPKNREDFISLKRMGFSDKRLSKLTGLTEKEVREVRCNFGVNPSYKRVDSCAAEFDSVTSYMYSTYEN